MKPIIKKKLIQILHGIKDVVNDLKHAQHNQQDHAGGRGSGGSGGSGGGGKPFDYPVLASSKKGKEILKSAGLSEKKNKTGQGIIVKKDIDKVGSHVEKKGFKHESTTKSGDRITHVYSKGNTGVKLTGFSGKGKLTAYPTLQGTITTLGGSYPKE